MDKKSNFLALCLLDALEDENISVCEELLDKFKASPNTLVVGRGIAPLHYACGMENIEIAEKIVKRMIKNGGNPNVRSDDNMTPMHVSAIWGRTNIFKMLLDIGGDINSIDDDKKTPVLYAIYECQFDVVKLIQNYIFEKKLEKKRNLIISANKVMSPNHLNAHFGAIKNLEDKKYTPNRINYNFDVTSPYFINITHRKKSNGNSLTSGSNIFELTKDNLEEYSKTLTENRSRISFINTWRDKVQRAKNRGSVLKVFNDMDSLLNDIMSDENVNFTNSTLDLNSSNESKNKKSSPTDMSFTKILEMLKNQKKSSSETSFLTAHDKSFNQSNFIRSPKDKGYVVQLLEEYLHTDDENGMVFYEKKIVSNPVEDKSKKHIKPLDSSRTSGSTDFTVPLDYDTEDLRAELTFFGEPPGPITKTTKRLYTKRLIKFKRDPNRKIAVENSEGDKHNQRFSVELQATLRSNEGYQRIYEFTKLEHEMSSYFQEKCTNQKQNWREGHLKTSFIYLLVDPRISDNLPGRSVDMETLDVWRLFLSSIFYVGKGKSSRPYAHLYDAMKVFSQKREKECAYGVRTFQQIRNVNYSKKLSESKKLERINDIWKANMGVICVHVFHNIMPVEAYTREAAIIECLGLLHLTNLKRGDFYGPAQLWTMRQKKHLGIALLYKALQIFLAEGESQLMPSDLV